MSIEDNIVPLSPMYNVAILSLSLSESVRLAQGLIIYLDDIYKEYTQARFGEK